MGELTKVYELRWRMKLSEEGYTTWEFLDDLGRRWGWVVNASHQCVAPDVAWMAHVGSWGQARLLGLGEVPVEEEIKSFFTAAVARTWIEERIAEVWKSKESIDAH